MGSVAMAQSQPPIQPSQDPSMPRLQPPLQPVEQGVGDVSPLGDSLRQLTPSLSPNRGFQEVYRDPRRVDLLMRASGALYAVFQESVYRPTKDGTMPDVPAGTVFWFGRPSDAQLAAPMLSAAASPFGVNQSLSGGSPSAAGSGKDAASTEFVGRFDHRIDTRVRSSRRPLPATTAQPMPHPGGGAPSPALTDAGSAAEPAPAADDMRLEAGVSSPLSYFGSNIVARDTTMIDRSKLPPNMVNDGSYRAARLRELLERAAAAEAHAGH